MQPSFTVQNIYARDWSKLIHDLAFRVTENGRVFKKTKFQINN